MGRMNKFALLRIGISAFYYPIKETFATFGEKVVGFLLYLLAPVLKLPYNEYFSAKKHRLPVVPNVSSFTYYSVISESYPSPIPVEFLSNCCFLVKLVLISCVIISSYNSSFYDIRTENPCVGGSGLTLG